MYPKIFIAILKKQMPKQQIIYISPLDTLIAVVENLWDKYAVSSRELEAEREETLAELNEFLSKLGYVV